MLKKIEYTKNNLANEKIRDILICPICKKKIKLINNSLICFNNHCFNITKKGYFTLLLKNKLRIDNMYNLNLFQNRIDFINAGFFDELHLLISQIIKQQDDLVIIVDMGCGDGTHDNKILNLINNNNIYIIGTDLSKIGIECSTKYVNNNFIPIVSDLNYLPLKKQSADLILNILSPSNEQEMKRILKKNGLIIKVTPKKEYLKELRQMFGIKEYENEFQLEDNIQKNYIILKKYTINEKKKLDDNTYINLFNMTPLTKNYKKVGKINEITIALNIYVLKARNIYEL